MSLITGEPIFNIFITSIVSVSAIAAMINLLSSWLIQREKINTSATQKITEGRDTWRNEIRQLVSNSKSFTKDDYNKIMSNLNAYSKDDNNLEYYMSDCHIKNIIVSDSNLIVGIDKSELVRDLLRLSLKYDWERSKSEIYRSNRHFIEFEYIEQIEKFYDKLNEKYYPGETLPKSFGRYESNLPSPNNKEKKIRKQKDKRKGNIVTKTNILYKYKYSELWLYLLVSQIISSFIVLSSTFSKLFNVTVQYNYEALVSFLIIVVIDMFISFLNVKVKAWWIILLTLIEILFVIVVLTLSVRYSFVKIGYIISVFIAHAAFTFLGFLFLLIKRSS